MKNSRSTRKQRRSVRHRSSGAWIGIGALVVIAGAGAYLGGELGWWSLGGATAKQSPKSATVAGGRPSPDHVAEAPRPPAPKPPDAPRTPDDGAVPTGAGFVAPKFGREFEDAIERGAFKDAEAALARVGSSADAERRLAVAMESARARIVARFDEIRSQSGERSARVYVSHQLVNFPDQAEARFKLQELLAVADSAPADLAVHVAPTASRPDSRVVETPVAEAVDTDLEASKNEGAKILDSGEAKTALSVLREVATAAEAKNQRKVLAETRRLIRKAEAELRLRKAIVDRVEKKVTGDKTVKHLPGERGAVLSANEDGITFAGQQGQVMLKWRVLPVHTLVELIPLLELSPAELTDAAATLYRSNHGPEADALLARASRAGAEIKPAIDQTLADARGMSVPAEGFRLVEDKWLSPQEFARHETAREIAASTKDLAAADAAVRQAAFARMMKLGDAAKSPLHRALLLRRAEIREDLSKQPVYAKLAELGKSRQELDDARAHALELIEDEVKYPYPYRPPEASAETFKLFTETQREVDIRVAKLRGLWNQQLSITVPKAFREKVAILKEIGGFLTALAAAPVEPDPGWLMFLPDKDEVTLQNVATSEADRNRIDESAVTMQSNATKPTKSTKGELDQARITNEYRVMFGRAAVQVHDLLTTAAHGHCDDMARLGFFSHYSPVPGKKTPYDRIEATGMKAIGGSENIAQAGGPQGAHEGWCHSSGHHRNLLAAGWKMIGVGNVGHTWCQNFTAGERKELPPDEGK